MKIINLVCAFVFIFQISSFAGRGKHDIEGTNKTSLTTTTASTLDGAEDNQRSPSIIIEEASDEPEASWWSVAPPFADWAITTLGMVASFASEEARPYAHLTLSLGITAAHLPKLRGLFCSQYWGDYEPEEKFAAVLKVLSSFGTTIPIAIWPDYAAQLTMLFFTGVATAELIEKSVKTVKKKRQKKRRRRKKKASLEDQWEKSEISVKKQ